MADIRFQNFMFKENGEFSIFNIAGSTMPTDMMALFRYVLQQKTGSSATASLYESGRSAGKELSKQLPSDPHALLLKLEVLGAGTFELMRFDKQGTILIKNDNNTLANSTKKLFGYQKDTVDELLSGILTGIFEDKLNKKLEGKEVQCIGQGKPACIFEIMPSRSS